MDVAEGYQIGFQDAASPIAEGIINFHNYVFIYLTYVIILVLYMVMSIVGNFKRGKRIIAHKYLVHGRIVPLVKVIRIR